MLDIFITDRNQHTVYESMIRVVVVVLLLLLFSLFVAWLGILWVGNYPFFHYLLITLPPFHFTVFVAIPVYYLLLLFSLLSMSTLLYDTLKKIARS